MGAGDGAYGSDDAPARCGMGDAVERRRRRPWCSTSTVDFVGPWADTPYMHRDIWVPRLGLLFAPAGRGRARSSGSAAGRGRRTSTPSRARDRAVRGHRSIACRCPTRCRRRTATTCRPGGSRSRATAFRPARRRAARLRLHGAAMDVARPAAGRQAARPARLRARVAQHRPRQQGIGSASVGPALPERYRVPRERTSWRCGSVDPTRPSRNATLRSAAERADPLEQVGVPDLAALEQQLEAVDRGVGGVRAQQHDVRPTGSRRSRATRRRAAA